MAGKLQRPDGDTNQRFLQHLQNALPTEQDGCPWPPKDAQPSQEFPRQGHAFIFLETVVIIKGTIRSPKQVITAARPGFEPWNLLFAMPKLLLGDHHVQHQSFPSDNYIHYFI